MHVAGKRRDALVFTAPNGGPLRNTNFRTRVFAPAAASVGLAGVTPHDLRHTAASLAVAAGANVTAVQRTKRSRRGVRTICGPAPPMAVSSTSGNGEAQADDLGFRTEPPDGIEPSTYALRVRRSSRLS